MNRTGLVLAFLASAVSGWRAQISLHHSDSHSALKENTVPELRSLDEVHDSKKEESANGNPNTLKALAILLLAPKEAAVFNPSSQRVLSKLHVTGIHPVSVPSMSVESSTPSPFLDEATIKAAAASFPLSPDELISKTKQWILDRNGLDAPDTLAESFEFMGPVVGPLSKSEYMETVGGFDINDAFPDLRPNFHDFRVDPFEPGRVWFTSRVRATFTGTFAGVLKGNGETVEMPPEAISVQWDGEGRVVRYTIGYVTDRARGNSGGLGGAFGILNAVGKPLPFREGRPWSKSLRYRLFDFVSSLAPRPKKKQ